MKKPYHCNFAITYKCNAKCKHCSINAKSVDDPKASFDLGFDKVMYILDEIAKLGVMFLGICGGEPLMYEGIEKVVEYANKKGMFVAIATNGMFLSEEKIISLKKAGIDSILVSLDFPNAKEHDAFRGAKGLFENALKGIRYCVKYNVPVILGYTPMKNNFHYLKEMFRIVENENMSAINISSYVPTGRGDINNDLDVAQWKELFFFATKMQKEWENKGIRVQIHDTRYAIYNNLETTKCMAGFNQIYVLPNGDVQPCVMLPINMGNLFEEKLEKIVDSFQKDFGLNAHNKLEGKCKRCRYNAVCGGCRAVALAYTGNVWGEDKHCWIQDERDQL